jgi:hypothetical protein
MKENKFQSLTGLNKMEKIQKVIIMNRTKNERTSSGKFFKVHFKLNMSFILFLIGISFVPIFAQPSGGPYGPIRQNYNIPKDANKIYYVSPNGQSENSGEKLDKPATIDSVIGKAVSGDAIIMRGGTYRTGNLILNQGITIQPYKDEQVIIKGTYIADKWENLENGLWITKWDRLFPSKPDGWWQRNREGKKTPLHRFNNDMVFVNGKFLQSAGWEGQVNENSFYIDYETGTVYIGIDPKDKLVEITAYDNALIRTIKECNGKKSDKKGYTIKGITFTQYAYRALEVEGTEPDGISEESKHGKEVVGTTLENCMISFCSRVAGYFRGDKLTIRQCKISETSTEGIYIIASNDVLLEKNIFTHNNIENITGYYPAAVKIFNQSYRVTCRDNLVIDLPNSNGIWYDVGNVDGVFINNWIEGVGQVEKTMRTNQLWPSDNGFFFEISKGAVCAGNVFVNCDHGLMIFNSSDVLMYNNTFINSPVCIGRNGRVPEGDHFGWHSSTAPGLDKRIGHIFVNNLLTGGEDYERPMLFVWQPANLCDKFDKLQLKELDYNIYVRAKEKSDYPLILWSPAQNKECQTGFESLESMNKFYPDFSLSGKVYSNYDGPLFKGNLVGNYCLMESFPSAKSGKSIPPDIKKMIGQSKKNESYIGAYPAIP